MNNRACASPVTKHPMVLALHTAVQGRARFKVRGLYRSDELKKYLESRLSSKKGINFVSARPATGHIIVRFDPECSYKAIAQAIEKLVLDYRNQKAEVGNRNSEFGIRKPEVNILLPVSPSPRLPAEPWHLKDAGAIVAELETSAEVGLASRAAREKLQRYGANVLSETPPRSGLSILLDYFKSVPVALLAAAAGLSLVTGGVADAVVIMGVVALNAALGYATESQSERIIHSLKHLVKPSAFVIRDGNLVEISAQEIVPGDILVLKPGSYVPADARLIEADRLSVDESALTGESIPVTKTPETLARPDAPLAERTNMVYMGTIVTGGQGLAVVVATGQNTEMGTIQTLVGETIVPQTPMEKQLDRAGSQLVLASSAVCGIVFGIGLLRGYGTLQMLKTSISLAVAAVPEGLPTVATTTLALGINNMRKHHVLIRRLDAVEALGSIQTICLDKTGTITTNQMSVVELYVDGQSIQRSDGKFLVGEEEIDPYTSDNLTKLMLVSVLCNDSEANSDENGFYVLNGSSTENALLQMAIDAGTNAISLREKYPRLETSHRSENHNFMTTVHLNEHHKFIAVKGNPTEVIDLCSWQIKNGKKVPLSEADKLSIEAENERMAGKALRVLAAAYMETDLEDNNGNLPEDLIWLGLIGMADPIRHGVKDLMGNFHQAGIDTIMITGDQSPTAYAIGKELNLSRGEQLQILDSTHLIEIDPEVTKGLCQRVHVFARISPSHKLQVVQALQQAGRVVAMTGDGINDAPALKAAEVGIAMGHTGTDVAREVADVVIEDDNLETMIIAVSQGRTIYNNIRKSVHFLLSTNTSEILVMLFATVGGLGQPLNAMQLLWLNLVTDIFPGLGLALEQPEPDVLSQPPRPPEEPILKQSDFKRITAESVTLSASVLGSYIYGILRYGIGSQASTIAFMSMVAAQLMHALSCRSEKHRVWSKTKLPPNRYLGAALGGSFALQSLCFIIPGLRSLLKLAPINALDGVVIGSSAFLPFVVNETTKKEQQENRATLKQESSEARGDIVGSVGRTGSVGGLPDKEETKKAKKTKKTKRQKKKKDKGD
ncbi:P-type ATPase, translocating [Pleurocapsa sp. PCC 7327]|uniref:cation-translocating P-type ATPase n=1 Tax=Pleurocapsa sp. PCC 7327 TaxID=118163 RepID=UPI00029F8E3D|nr:HAD-IC family P-type ATPase [Pleurocapsa sp. PCC 7327]AFY78252.1 P-type ATPase, translocating [Pleurocapsa sp. PCC 7327]